MHHKGYVSKFYYQKPASGYEEYPHNLSVLHHLKELVFHEKVTYLVGENGSGKSTLIEAIAIAYGLNPEGGTVNFGFSTKNTASDLYKHIRLAKTVKRPRSSFFLRAESFYNMATYIEELNGGSYSGGYLDLYGGKSLHEQSHGESFLSLILHRWSEDGFYIIDEPEAALSASNQLAFIAHLHELVTKNSQFIIATHSPIILSYPDSVIYQIDHKGIRKTSYEDTEQYRFTKLFLNHYPKMLKEIMK